MQWALVAAAAGSLVEDHRAVRLVKAGSECGSPDQALGTYATETECAEAAVAAAAGTAAAQVFFSYGTGASAGQCKLEQAASEACPIGFVAAEFDFLAIDPVDQPHGSCHRVKSVLSHRTCAANQTRLADALSLQQCADFVRIAEGRYFVYGNGANHACTVVKTTASTCPEGVSYSATESFFDLEPQTPPGQIKDKRSVYLLNASADCGATNEDLGVLPTVNLCAEAVLEKGGTLFAYGAAGSNVAASCQMKKTAAIPGNVTKCPEGISPSAQYDLYALGYETSCGTGVMLTECETYKLTHSGALCAAPALPLPNAADPAVCGESAFHAGARFFTFDNRSCSVLQTAADTCPEGLAYTSATMTRTVYSITPLWTHPGVWVSGGKPSKAPGKYVELLKPGMRCAAGHEIGPRATLQACAETVAQSGGTHLSYGIATKLCRVEITVDTCPEGFVPDPAFNFYTLGTVPVDVTFPDQHMKCEQPITGVVRQPMAAQAIVGGAGKGGRVKRDEQRNVAGEALAIAQATARRVEELRQGLLRGARAHAAAMQPPDTVDLAGMSKLIRAAQGA